MIKKVIFYLLEILVLTLKNISIALKKLPSKSFSFYFWGYFGNTYLTTMKLFTTVEIKKFISHTLILPKLFFRNQTLTAFHIKNFVLITKFFRTIKQKKFIMYQKYSNILPISSIFQLLSNKNLQNKKLLFSSFLFYKFYYTLFNCLVSFLVNYNFIVLQSLIY